MFPKEVVDGHRQGTYFSFPGKSKVPYPSWCECISVSSKSRTKVFLFTSPGNKNTLLLLSTKRNTKIHSSYIYVIVRPVKKFLSSRLIMNSRWLLNSHQRHKLLRAKASTCRDILKVSLGNHISRGFQEVFSTADTMLFCQNTCKTGNNAIEMSQASHDITQFECFTDLNLFKCAFTIIQNHLLGNRCFTILFDGAYFLLAGFMVEGDESSRLRMAN